MTVGNWDISKHAHDNNKQCPPYLVDDAERLCRNDCTRRKGLYTFSVCIVYKRRSFVDKIWKQISAVWLGNMNNITQCVGKSWITELKTGLQNTLKSYCVCGSDYLFLSSHLEVTQYFAFLQAHILWTCKIISLFKKPIWTLWRLCKQISALKTEKRTKLILNVEH